MWSGSLKDTLLLEHIYGECEAMKVHKESEPSLEVLNMMKKNSRNVLSLNWKEYFI